MSRELKIIFLVVLLTPFFHNAMEQPPSRIAPSPGNVHELLLQAARAGRVDEVESALAAHANVEVIDENGMTPLHWAAVNGHTDIAVRLINLRANLDAANIYGNTPLIEAVAQGHIEAVTLLIAHNANSEKANLYGLTPLHYAAVKGHSEIVRSLLVKGSNLEAKDNDGRTPLVYAVLNEHKELVELLLAYGAFIDQTQSDLINRLGGLFRGDPLFIAVAFGVIDSLRFQQLTVRHLSDKKIKLLLCCAVGQGRRSIARYLIEQCDQGSQKFIGGTGLKHVRSLLKCTLTPQRRQQYTRLEKIMLVMVNTRLLLAAGVGDSDAARNALEGADINVRNSQGTALLIAAQLGHFDMVKLLLTHENTDPLVDRDRSLETAAGNRCVGTVCLLLEYGALLNAENAAAINVLSEFFENDALLLASVQGNLDSVKSELLRRKKELIENAYGSSGFKQDPFHSMQGLFHIIKQAFLLAMGQGHNLVVEFLIRYLHPGVSLVDRDDLLDRIKRLIARVQDGEVWERYKLIERLLSNSFHST